MKEPHTQAVVAELPLCDYCKQNGIKRPARYDAKVKIATYWANMCPGHYKLYGIGLGLGKGQKLVTPDEAAIQ
jgi:hypothetical protein